MDIFMLFLALMFGAGIFLSPERRKWDGVLVGLGVVALSVAYFVFRML